MVSEETVGHDAQARNLQRLYLVAMVVCSALTVWAVMTVPYMPTNDGPEAVFGVHVMSRYEDPNLPFSKQYSLAIPWANLGFPLIYTPLYELLGWEVGLRVAFSLMALLGAWAFAWLIHALMPERRWLGLLGFTTALCWPLYMGFFSFTVSSVLGVAALALAVRDPDPPPSRRVVVALVTLLTLGLHAVAGMTACLAVMGVSVLRVPPQRWFRELMWAALIAVPMLAFALALNGSRDSLEKVPMSDTTMWESILALLVAAPKLAVPGPMWRAVIYFLLAAAGPIWTLIEWRRRTANERAVAIVGGTLFLAACALPLHIPGWQYFAPRFFVLGVPMCLALLPLERLRRPVALVPAALTAVAVFSAWVSAGMHRRIYDGCSKFLAGLHEPLNRTSVRLPITLEAWCGVADARWHREVPYLEAPVHLGALYAVATGGGVSATFQGSSGVHLLRPKGDPVPRPPFLMYMLAQDTHLAFDARLRRATMTEVASWAMVHDDVVVLASRQEDADLFKMRGFRIDFQAEHMLIAKFEGCPLDVEVRGSASRSARVQWGAWGLRDIADLPLKPAETEEPRTVKVQALCGDLFVRVYWPGDDPARCQEAREDGKMKVASVREGKTVVCTSP